MRLRDTRIGVRLSLAFGAVLLLVSIAVGVAVYNVSQTSEAAGKIAKYFPIIRAEEELSLSIRDEINLTGHLFMPGGAAQIDKVTADMADMHAKGDEGVKTLDTLVQSEQGKKELAAMKEARASFVEKRDAVLQLVKSGKADDARKLFDGDLAVITDSYKAKLAQFTDTQIKHADIKTEAAIAVAKQTEGTLLGGVALALIVAVLISILITRSISRPLSQATRVANAVAQGDLSVAISSTSRDETGMLLAAMQSMRDSLRGFMGAQAEMFEQHVGGNIDHRLPVESFKGDYGRMAQGINDLTSAHIGVIQHVVEIVKHYAEGDFAHSIDRLPGKMSEITAAIDGVKGSFESMSSEMMRLVEAAAQGEFSARGDSSRFKHSFRSMIEGLNRLMGTAEAGLNDVAMVLGAIAEGDLRPRIEGEYAGTFGKLKNDTNRTAEELSSIVSEIRTTADLISTAASQIAAGNANLSERTERQAASLEETAASMEELESTVKRNAESAGQANGMSANASKTAVKGGEVVSEVVSKMELIDASSRKIAEIIGVIDGIAFQTNILALNAAVEAARAGE